jgi:hypothetical protein
MVHSGGGKRWLSVRALGYEQLNGKLTGWEVISFVVYGMFRLSKKQKASKLHFEDKGSGRASHV